MGLITRLVRMLRFKFNRIPKRCSFVYIPLCGPKIIFAENRYATDFKLLKNDDMTVTQTCQNDTTFGFNTNRRRK